MPSVTSTGVVSVQVETHVSQAIRPGCGRSRSSSRVPLGIPPLDSIASAPLCRRHILVGVRARNQQRSIGEEDGGRVVETFELGSS